MQLENNEHSIQEMDGSQTITITKEALEKWVNHYHAVAQDFLTKGKEFHCGFYMGKREVLIDLLKHFQEE